METEPLVHSATRLAYIKALIPKSVLVTKENAQIVRRNGDEAPWILDFRRIFLDADALDALTDLFFERMERFYPFQVTGMESASIPLVTAIVLKSKERGLPINGFYIRKSRKKYDLLKQVEGTPNALPVVLVDDLINRGGTFLKQVELLASHGLSTRAVFAVVRFRDPSVYTALSDQNIHIESLFTIEEFGLQLNTPPLPRHDIFSTTWYRGFPNAALYRVGKKSSPVCDQSTVYFGTDDGHVYALDQKTGEERWHFQASLRRTHRHTVLDLSLDHNTLYAATHSGNVFALDTQTGRACWVYAEADWIDSSPVLSAENETLYVALTAGWFHKRHHLTAIDTRLGRERWRIDLPEAVKTAPVLSPNGACIGVACLNGEVLLLDTARGDIRWRSKLTTMPSSAPTFTPDGEHLIVGEASGMLACIQSTDGALTEFQAAEPEHPIIGAPLCIGEKVVVSSLDKFVYCLNLKTQEKLWEFETRGRIFATPVFIENSIYIGSNDSRLYMLDLETGAAQGLFQVVERICNPLLYCPATHAYFLTTFANELYCLRPRDASGDERNQ